MKHTIEELQFAATVRDLVQARRRAMRPPDATPEQIAAIDAAPANALIKEVLAELDGIAGVIARDRSATGVQSPTS